MTTDVILESDRRSRRLWRRHRRRRPEHLQPADHESSRCSDVVKNDQLPRPKHQESSQEKLEAPRNVMMPTCDDYEDDEGRKQQVATRTVITEGRSRRRKTKHLSQMSKLIAAASSRYKHSDSLLLLLSLLLMVAVGWSATMTSGQQQPLAASSSSGRDEYQLVGQAADQVHLPCLIGRQLYCGEPYFIAWYKLNLTSKSWARIEHKSEEELASAAGDALNERVRFTWSRGASVGARSACEQARGANSAAAAGGRLFEWSNFECGQLTISKLELADEGQYKCEITFSESLDFDKCPATTLSQLNVIARPNEPELLVNGRSVATASAASAAVAQATASPPLTFKEGAQVRLECQSSGGRPAPRIEWLNVSQPIQPEQTTDEGLLSPLENTDSARSNELGVSPMTELALNRDPLAGTRQRVAEAPEVQLMRAHWPTQKKATLVQTASETAATSGTFQGLLGSAAGQPAPITSSSVTISLSRYDLNSRFVCLVLPATSPSQQQHHHQQQQQPQLAGSSAASAAAAAAAAAHEQLIKSPAYLRALLSQQQQRQTIPGSTPMLKWIKLDVQVKPSRVSVLVRDVEANATLQQVQQQQQMPAGLLGAGGAFVEPQMSPFYSLQLNRLYAIQCVADNSRPRSHVTWFNRTAPIGLSQVQLNSSGGDYLLPGDYSQHRLTSFTRTIEHANGTFRTTATLLLTTNAWDNFEELFCRISNEAFQFDELSQVAPIVSARLYVNYPPVAWLEGEGTKWTDSGQVGRLKASQTGEFTLRCFVAANPLGQNTILQFEWLKDGRKLVASNAHDSKHQQSSHQQQQQQHSLQAPTSRVQIEKANHLHMPLSQLAESGSPTATALMASSALSSSSTSRHIKSMPGNQLVAGSKLIGASSLTISALTKADSGAYACQFKLIPAPSPAQGAAASQQHQQQIRIISGQANQTIQVNVIEAKPRAPTLRISSSKGLLIYGLRSPPGGSHSPWPTALVELGAEISLKCDLPQPATQQQQQQLSVGHKVTWYLNGAFIHSSGSSDTYNFTVGSALSDTASKLGTFSCAHQLLSSSGSQFASDNFHGSLMRVFQSSNQIDLKSKVGPKLLRRRELYPALRSFSELELSASSASKLKLACLAQCEPICSIDWYLNERLLTALATPTTSPVWLSAATNDSGDNSANQTSSIYKQAREFALLHSLGLAAKPTATTTLTLLENVIHRKNDSKFSWTRESNLNVGVRISSMGSGGQSFLGLSSSPALSQSEAASFERASWQLRREAGDQLSPNDANVFSKLELTYYQIAQLLLGQTNAERGRIAASSDSNGNNDSTQLGDGEPLLIKCKLNKVLNAKENPSLPFAANGATNGATGATGATASSSSSGKNNNNNGALAFGHARIERGRWFPEAAGASSGADRDDDYRYQLAMSNGPLDLAALYADEEAAPNYAAVGNDNRAPTTANSYDDDDANSKRPEIDNESRQLQPKQQLSSSTSDWTDLHSGRAISALPASSSQQQLGFGKARQQNGDSSFVDEMQIRILLDRAPASASIAFGVIVSDGDGEPGKVSLTESQLLELTDPNQPAPLLRCRAGGHPYPEPKFEWTFTDSNRTRHSIANADSSELNLRQFIEFRQRQLNVDPTSAYGVDVVANIVGNYTCTVANVHGSKSATLAFQIQGRPLCKLTLAGEYLGAENELMANLRCTIYSAQPVLETVWFRNNQQLAVNKSSLDMLSWSNREPVSIVELPVMVLSKQQDFMLSDMMTQVSNFKCMARNPHGYSEACDLNQVDKQTILNTFKPIGGLGTKSPALSMVSYPTDNKLGMSPAMNYISNGSNSIIDSPPGNRSVSSKVRNFFARLDWLLITGCSLIFIWLLFVTGIVRRRCFDSRRLRTKDAGANNNNNTNWRFNTTRANSNNDTVGGPFQSKICVNYYGDSNGDSEHDMIQSCNSQSSHYEEFAQQQQRLMLNQQQPLYFNQANHHHSTLSRRPLKSSVSTSSTGDSSTGSRHGQQQQQMARLGEPSQTNRPIMANTMRVDPHFSSHYSQSNHLAATMRESLANNRLSSCGTNIPGANGLTLASNVPLINGTHNSRINLDQQQRQQAHQQHYQRFNRDQQTFSGAQIRNNEHIYDDIIYNQIIL